MALAGAPAASDSETADTGHRAGARRPGAGGLALGAGVVAVCLLAGLLRLVELGQVPNDPFYDAAVRSMGLSWHNFFFGAFEPAGSVSIDKPPLDLWLQVASTRLLGFSSATLKLPPALAGTAAVALLFVAARRAFGSGPALIASLVFAVLPASVLTARSDTMDSVMMALIVLALIGVLEACATGRVRWLYASAVMVGLAFNVKLLEALIPVPALAVMVLLGLPRPVGRRLAHLAAAGGVLVAVSLSWLSATLLFTPHQRPFAIGSTNGSAWNAAFVFNGYDRIAKPARADTAADPASAQPERPIAGQRYRRGSEAALDHLPIRPPSATRLLNRAGPLSGRRLGFVLVAALLLGLPALAQAAGIRRRGPPSRPGVTPPAGAGATAEATNRVRRAAAVGVGLWLLGGTVLFSAMTRLHPRYAEAFTPAVAIALGVGVVWAVQGPRLRRGLLAAVVLGLAAYAGYLKGGSGALVAITALAGLAAVTAAELAPRRLRALAGAGLASAALLALPTAAALALIRNHETDAGHVGAMRASEVSALSAYLRSHQGNARYEVAVAAATQAGALIVHDALPVLVLTTYDGRTLVSAPQLARFAAQGRVHYALLGGGCNPGKASTAAQCSEPGRWILAHATNVSREAHLQHSSLLWRLPTR